MRNAVKTVGRLAKEKSRTAYREVRSKFKDMQIHRELEGAAYTSGNSKLRDKPRSAPSSPKLSSDMSASQRRTAVSPPVLTQQLNSNFLDRNHSLRRCETSVSQHYHAGSSPGFPSATSSSDDSGTEDELNMTPLNLNLMDDMKDILAKTASRSTPPAVDRSVNTNFFFCPVIFVCFGYCLSWGSREVWFLVYFIISFFCFFVFFQRKPSLSSPPIPPIDNPVLRQNSAPVLNVGPFSVQPIPLPPLRCRKRSEAQNSPLTAKVIEALHCTSHFPFYPFCF